VRSNIAATEHGAPDAVSSGLRHQAQAEDPALDIGAVVVIVGHVLDVGGAGDEVVGGEAVVKLGDVRVEDPGLGAVEIALGDAGVVGLAAPEPAADVQTAGAEAAVVEDVFVVGPGQAQEGTEMIAEGLVEEQAAAHRIGLFRGGRRLLRCVVRPIRSRRLLAAVGASTKGETSFRPLSTA
jgi:hypothetical protein